MRAEGFNLEAHGSECCWQLGEVSIILGEGQFSCNDEVAVEKSLDHRTRIEPR